MKEKKRIYVFDFDGTITSKDSLLQIVSFSKGNARLICGLLRFCVPLLLMLLHKTDNGKLKERFVKHFFGGTSLHTFNRMCSDFAVKRLHIVRKKAFETLLNIHDTGARIIVLTASPENWVKPMIELLDVDAEVVGTQLEVKEGRLTGRFSTENCYGPEKVKRLKRIIADRDQYHIIAYGDSRGDKELLEFADEAHYKPFR